MGRRFVDMRTIQRRMDGKDFYRNRETQRREAAAAMANHPTPTTNRLALATTPGGPLVTPDHLELARATVAKDATPVEFDLFLYDCARQGVHPLDKLIYFTKRKGRYVPLTSIDFLRTRAQDSGECAGIDDAVFTGPAKTAAFTATVTVYRLVQGQRCTFSASARWSEYRPDEAFMWEKMPHVMLGKCAEALALRKAFPKQLAGLYIKEEMEQAENQPAPLVKSLTPSPGPVPAGTFDPEAGAGAPVAPADLNENIPESWKPLVTPPAAAAGGKLISVNQIKRLWAIVDDKKWHVDRVKKWLIAQYGVESSKDIKVRDYDGIIAYLEHGPVTEADFRPDDDPAL